jgi:DNA-binding NarL/FixJ family response regulator
VRVLVASGMSLPQEAARLKEAGARGIIYKPFRLAELEQRIQAVLSGEAAF